MLSLFCFHACDPCLVALVAKNKIFQIMVLDCGGGTIDITSHLVESSDPLQLSELAEPCGGAWGSSIVDARFKAFLQVSTTQKRGVTSSLAAVFKDSSSWQKFDVSSGTRHPPPFAQQAHSVLKLRIYQQPEQLASGSRTLWWELCSLIYSEKIAGSVENARGCFSPLCWGTR